MNRAIFLDRDGVINEDSGYVGKIDDFKFKDGIFEFIRFFQQYGFLIFIITNQSGIARGFYSEDDFKVLTNWMLEQFKLRGIEIKDVEFCPHHPDITGACSCRKPDIGMIVNLTKRYDIDLASSFLVGDSLRDIEAGKKAGIRKNYLLKGNLLDTLDEIVAKEKF